MYTALSVSGCRISADYQQKLFSLELHTGG